MRFTSAVPRLRYHEMRGLLVSNTKYSPFLYCTTTLALGFLAPSTIMAPFVISQCRVADGAALAANSIPAFWADPNWVLAWRHRTLEYHVSQIALRFPRNLLNNRVALRHQKAVDLETGRILV